MGVDSGGLELGPRKGAVSKQKHKVAPCYPSQSWLTTQADSRGGKHPSRKVLPGNLSPVSIKEKAMAPHSSTLAW